MNPPVKKRNSNRVKPDEGTIAKIDTSGSPGFRITNFGLVMNQSEKGCALVVLSDLPIKVGDRWKLEIGQGQPKNTEVRWQKVLEDNVKKIGLMIVVN
jgi:hypothetical protein